MSVETGDREIAAQFVNLRSTPAAAWASEDLGEYMTVATALEWRRRGRKVYFSIDDREGTELADKFGLSNLRTRELVTACIRAGLVPTRADLTKLWMDLRKYSRLPTLAETSVVGEWDRWNEHKL
ncbi:hypothetical protein ACFQW6_00785 [Nocardioides sp. GCM10028917]|uniref:hypothetical protein n=1 Tax=Nocardioides sp. GCM10028917 TaxID=3273408 RepID=UPI003617042C